MASPSPPILPISNTQASTAAGEPDQTPAFRAFINHITSTVHTSFSQRRPWSELVDRSTFSKPESVSDATLRLRKNYSYFRVNYLSVVAGVLAFSLITNPFSLLLLFALLSGWLFLYLLRQPSDPPVTLFNRTFSQNETLGLLLVSTIVVVFLTSVGSILVGALMIGLAIVGTHAAFRIPEDLFLDEQSAAATTGFLSFLTGSSSTTSSAAPPVAVRG